MKLDFVKQHGCGNDYIYVNGFVYDIENPSETAKTLSDRHFGKICVRQRNLQEKYYEDRNAVGGQDGAA